MAAVNPLAADELSADEDKLLRGVEDETPVAEADAPAEPKQETATEPDSTNSGTNGALPVSDGDSPAPTEPAEPQRTVPLASLIEERKERQRIEKELAEYRGSTEARLKAIQERLAKPKEEESKAPTLETDPVGVLRQTREELQALQQQRQGEQQLAQFSGYVANQVQEFRAQTPDYDAALQHARNSRIGELKIMGLNDQQARDRLALDEFAFAQSVIQAGRNVGQALYEYAGLKGYKKQEAAVQQQVTPTAEQKLETIVKGQQAAKSLGGASGAVGAPPLNIDMLEKMSAEQIGALSDDEFRRLMGG